MKNYREDRQLLCTFSGTKEFKKIAEEIRKFYKVYNNRIFVFENSKNPKEIYLTYNVINMLKASSKFSNTILIHRKKQTNTLYTLNAMNRLIEEENGKLDPEYVVNWKLYENSLIITADSFLNIVPLKINLILE